MTKGYECSSLVEHMGMKHWVPSLVPQKQNKTQPQSFENKVDIATCSTSIQYLLLRVRDDRQQVKKLEHILLKFSNVFFVKHFPPYCFVVWLVFFVVVVV
jgi:hypothetical protein